MSDPGYEVVSVDDLDRYAPASGSPIMMPVGSRLGFRPYGINCWAADAVGDHVIERHREAGGPEELYVVLRGHATFTVGETTMDAPAGTLVFVPPGTPREAVATEARTIVLALGAKPGEAFEPTGWQNFRISDALRREGRIDEAREIVRAAIEGNPEAWQGHFNAACFESLAGSPDAAFDHLRRALEAGGEEARNYALADADFDPVRKDPRWAELIG